MPAFPAHPATLWSPRPPRDLRWTPGSLPRVILGDTWIRKLRRQPGLPGLHSHGRVGKGGFPPPWLADQRLGTLSHQLKHSSDVPPSTRPQPHGLTGSPGPTVLLPSGGLVGLHLPSDLCSSHLQAPRVQ